MEQLTVGIECDYCAHTQYAHPSANFIMNEKVPILQYLHDAHVDPIKVSGRVGANIAHDDCTKSFQ